MVSQLGLSTGTRDPGTRCRVITRVVKFHPGTRENVASMSIFYINGGQTSAPMRLFCVYIVARETI